MYRDEELLVPMPYYDKMPEKPTADIYCVLDIMLATGGSACDAIERVERYGKPVLLVSLIAAPEGVRRVAAAHPNTRVFVGALDSHLNDKGYIVLWTRRRGRPLLQHRNSVTLVPMGKFLPSPCR